MQKSKDSLKACLENVNITKWIQKQLRHLVSFAGTWLLHIGVLRKLHTKVLVRPKLEYAVPIWSPHSKLQIIKTERDQRTAARWTCRRWQITGSVGEMLAELEWPSLEARRDQPSRLLFHKIHCGAVSIEKDKYMDPAHSLKTTGSSHSAQYLRHQTYSDALKNSFSPELFHIGIVCLLLWPITSPQRSSEHSLFEQKFSQKVLCVFCCCCFLLLVVFLFYQNFKISTPWRNAQV